MTDQLRIVCVHPEGTLSSELFRAVQRARRTLHRSGYAARIDLLPLRDLPEGADEVINVAPPDFGAAFDGLLQRLTAEGRLERGAEPPRAIAVHRGFRAVGERARIAE